MLSLFKSNNPIAVAFYIIYIVLFRVIFFFLIPNQTFVFQYREPLSNWLFAVLKNLPINFAIVSLLLAAALCFFQAILVNNIVNENKMLPKKSYLAGGMFIIFASFFKETLFLTPETLALTFLMLCTSRIFTLIKKEKMYGNIFDTGFLIGLATLFYFPSILFIVFVYFGMASVRPFVLREWVAAFLGFINPFFLVFTYYFWNDRTAEMFLAIPNIHPEGWLIGINLLSSDKVLIGGLVVATITSLVLIPGALYSSLIQVRKFANLLIVFIVLAGITFLLQQQIHLSHFVLFGLPLGIIVSMVLMQIKRNAFAEVIHLILILLILAMQFLPLINII